MIRLLTSLVQLFLFATIAPAVYVIYQDIKEHGFLGSKQEK